MAANLTGRVATFGAVAIRVARLDGAGVPNPGANNGYVVSAPIEVKMPWAVKSGNRFEQRNGNGGVCTVVQQPDDVQGLSVDLTLCQLDAEFLEILTGGTTFKTGVAQDIIGYKVPPLGTVPQLGVAVEMWTQNRVGGSPDPNYPYVRIGLPKVTWRVGDMTLVEGIQNILVHGVVYENPAFEDGPWGDWPGILDTIQGWFLDTVAPAGVIGYIPVTAS